MRAQNDARVDTVTFGGAGYYHAVASDPATVALNAWWRPERRTLADCGLDRDARALRARQVSTLSSRAPRLSRAWRRVQFQHVAIYTRRAHSLLFFF